VPKHTAQQEVLGPWSLATSREFWEGFTPSALTARREQDGVLRAEVAERYAAGRTLADVSDAWRPFRTWASVHLQALRERRTHEISPPTGQ
jgi:DNA-3-methyladenine glycosylase II